MINSVEFWDRVAAREAKASRFFEMTQNRTKTETRKYLKNSDAVLDFGCGSGSKTVDMAGVASRVLGIDTSAGMIEVAKDRAMEKNVANVEFLHTDIFDEKLADQSFDVVTAFNVLHLIDNPENVVERINNLLKPGGLFISATACLREKTTLPGIVVMALSRFGRVPKFNRFRATDIRAWMIREKFDIVADIEISPAFSEHFIVARRG